MPHPPSRKRKISPYLLLTLTALFWAGNFVLGRAMSTSLPPLALSFWRWVIALLILLPFALPRVCAQWPLIRRHIGLLALLAILSVSCFNSLAYMGLQSTTATNAVILNSIIPVLIILFSWLFLGQRLSLLQGLGVACSLIGVLAIIVQLDPAILWGLKLNTGDLWILTAVVCWAIYTICLKWRPAGLDPLAFLLTIVVIGLLVIAPFYAWEISRGEHFDLTVANLATIAYVGIFPGVLAYIFWNRGVAEVGASRAGLFIHLMPVFGALLSLVFLGESLHFYHFVGAALIFFGIALTNTAQHN